MESTERENSEKYKVPPENPDEVCRFVSPSNNLFSCTYSEYCSEILSYSGLGPQCKREIRRNSKL